MRIITHAIFFALYERTVQIFSYKLILEVLAVLREFEFSLAWKKLMVELDELSEVELFNTMHDLKKNREKIMHYSYANESPEEIKIINNFISQIKLFYFRQKYFFNCAVIKIFHKIDIRGDLNEKF